MRGPDTNLRVFSGFFMFLMMNWQYLHQRERIPQWKIKQGAG
jgi:hypothetical protein